MRKSAVFLIFSLLMLCTSSYLFAAPDMLVLQRDIYVESGNAPGTTEAQAAAAGNTALPVQGVHLYVRKKDGIESVMLVETTKDPAGKEDNFAYRALEYNSINGNEIRYLNGKVLESKYSKFSLVSSTVVKHPVLGECFHIYIPPVVEYGYPWSRHGTVTIGKGMFINIRTFSKKYGDYEGEFADNPFMFDFGTAKKSIPPVEEVPVKETVPPAKNQHAKETTPPVKEPPVKETVPPVKNPPDKEPAPVPEPVVLTLTDDYNPEAAQKFNEIATKGKGLLRFSKGPETLSDDVLASVNQINPRDKVDVVFAIDTTGSMKDDMETLRKVWVPKMLLALTEFGDVRLGLLLYRDYGDSYNHKSLPVKYYAFTTDMGQFIKNLNGVVIHGNEGGDVPEAVYEALYASLTFYEWRADAQKKIILIGDAEPHPTPRGSKKISQKTVTELAEKEDVTLDCIIVPDDKSSSRGR